MQYTICDRTAPCIEAFNNNTMWQCKGSFTLKPLTGLHATVFLQYNISSLWIWFERVHGQILQLKRELLRACVVTVGWRTAREAGRSRVLFPVVPLTSFFRLQYGAGVKLVSNRNEYQKYFLGVKACLTNLPPSCADCLEIWEPQPPETLRACPGLYKGIIWL
jgi:hypothetical protein